MTTPRKDLSEAAATMGRKGGQAKSEAKTRAVRQNITDAWIARRLTGEERDAIRWALGVYLDTEPLETDVEYHRRAAADSALAKLQVRKEPPHDD